MCIIPQNKIHILDVLHDSLVSLANTASAAALLQLKKSLLLHNSW